MTFLSKVGRREVYRSGKYSQIPARLVDFLVRSHLRHVLAGGRGDDLPDLLQGFLRRVMFGLLLRRAFARGHDFAHDHAVHEDRLVDGPYLRRRAAGGMSG